ncbi:MCE family protein [Solicola sp. PLA-1-18]|uniref:MCE family protein n=1 Tax=Solicola sp. PLA-1-18 TaxID=3380532 RepID=UPI003B764D10
MKFSGLRRLGALALGTAVLSGCSLSPYDLPLPGGADLGDDPYEVTVMFRDVLDLVPQSAVKVNDLTVGKVRRISLDGWTAKVTLQLRRDVELPDNAQATLRQTSLLGEKFVSLAPPSGGSVGRLGPGDVIPLAQSSRNPEVEEVLSALSLVLNGGGIENLATITSELNNALEGNGPELKRLLGDADDVIGELDRNKEGIITALERLNRLAEETKKQTDAITGALDDLPPALETLDQQRDDLVRLLESLDRLSDVGVGVIDASKDATIEDLKRLQPILARLTEAGDSLPGAFSLGPTFPFSDAFIGDTPAEARKRQIGDFANLSIKLNLDLPTLLQGVGGVQNSDSNDILKDLADALGKAGGNGSADGSDGSGDSSTPAPSDAPTTSAPTTPAPSLPSIAPVLPPLLGNRPSTQGGGQPGVVPQLCKTLGLCRVSPEASATASSVDRLMRDRGLDPELASTFIVPVVAQ